MRRVQGASRDHDPAVCGSSDGAREPDYAALMRLPSGVTCANCVNCPICDGLFGAVRQALTSCDFYPSRFRPQPDIEAELQSAVGMEPDL